MHPLKVLDESVETAGMEGVSADEKRLQRKDATQAVILQIAADDAIDAAMAAEPHDLREGGQHRDKSMKRLGAVALVADSVEFGCMALHLLVAGKILRRKTLDLVAHRGGVAGQVEVSPVDKTNPVEGRHRQEGHMVTPVFTEKREEFVQKEWRGDHRRSGIEVKTIVPHNTPTAAELVESFDEGHLISERAGAQRGRDAAKTATDDDDAPSAHHAAL
jgi:hypothetical protein